MAGPISGLGGQQQVPLSQGNRVQQEEAKSKKIESQSEAAAKSNQVEKDEEKTILQQLLREAQDAEKTSSRSASARRGSVVDVTV